MIPENNQLLGVNGWYTPAVCTTETLGTASGRTVGLPGCFESLINGEPVKAHVVLELSESVPKDIVQARQLALKHTNIKFI